MRKTFGKLFLVFFISSMLLFSTGPGKALAATTPTPVTPSGTINARSPQFQWNTVSGANQYQLAVVKGTTVVYTKTVGLEMCGPSTCGFRPPIPLSYGTYKWHVKARDYTSGVWGGFGPYLTFQLVNDPTIPVLQSPWGFISTKTPTYFWNKVTGATQYQFTLEKDGTVINTKTLPSGICGTTTCSYTPTTVLSNGNYQWKVMAMVSGVWKKYSPYNYFIFNSGFDSQFTSNATGWTPLNGTWNIASGSYQSLGLSNSVVSTSRVYGFSSYAFEVKMLRTGCANCENSIYFKGTPGSLTREGEWDTGYRFAITNDGMFSIIMFTGTLNGFLVDWTPYSGITSSWNTLKVIVAGTNAQFFINGSRVAYGILPPLTNQGKLGIGFYRDISSTANRLNVDWARAYTPQTTLAEEGTGGVEIQNPDAWTPASGSNLNTAP